MWLLPTFRRPDLCRQAIEACRDTGMTTAAVLFIDPPTDGYEQWNMSVPPNWIIKTPGEQVGMAASMRWVFETFPHEPFYGWLSDDLHPRTQGWDEQMVEAADRFFMVCCNDLQLAIDPMIRDGVLPGAMCWGGDLVRTVGWWALPGVYQGGIDDAWIHLAHRIFDVKKYLPDVIVEHMSYRNGKRPKDYTDEWIRSPEIQAWVADGKVGPAPAGEMYVERDLVTFNNWRASLEPYVLGLKIKDALRSAGYDVEGDFMENTFGPGFRARQTA